MSNSEHWFTTSFLRWRKVPESDARSVELCESRGGRPGPSVLTKSYGFRGRKAILNHAPRTGLSLSLICQPTSEDIKQHNSSSTFTTRHRQTTLTQSEMSTATAFSLFADHHQVTTTNPTKAAGKGCQRRNDNDQAKVVGCSCWC